MSTDLSYIRLPESQLKQGLLEPTSIEKMFYEEGVPAERRFDLRSAYQILNFLLTGTLWEGEEPLGHTLFLSDTVQGTRENYGTFRYLLPDQVQAVWLALQPISPEALWARFDLAAVQTAHVSPENWTGSDEDRDYVQHHFTKVKSFYECAAQAGDAIVLNIN
jgi:hypothetical protein